MLSWDDVLKLLVLAAGMIGIAMTIPAFLILYGELERWFDNRYRSRR